MGPLAGEPAAQIFLFIAAGLLYALYRVYTFSAAVHYKSKGGLKVPDGRFWQLPFVGETVELILASDVNDFLRRHTSKYGETFTTVLFGEPIIMTTSIEAAWFALGSPQSLENFDTCYAYSLWGKDCMPLMNRQNSHLRVQLKKLFLQGLGAAENQRKLCPTFSSIAMKRLSSRAGWSKPGPVVAKDELADYMYRVCLKLILGIDEKEPRLEQVRQWHYDVEKAEFVPRYWKLPGTTFHKGVKSRKQLCNFIEELIEERRMKTGYEYNCKELNEEKDPDLLDAFMEADIVDGEVERNEKCSTRKLRVPEIRDNIILALSAGHITPAVVLTWVLKLLAEHPKALEEVQEEQDEIAQQLKLEGRVLLKYEDTRKMQSTWRVVQETMRMRAPGFAVPRRAAKDLEFQGKLIPRGWRVFVFLQPFMMDPQLHPDPATFNPSRFKDPMRPHTYVPYGNGPRLCPGIEFSRLEILVFLHHFVTTRSWTLVDAQEGIRQWPMPVPAKGCPMIVYPRSQKHL